MVFVMMVNMAYTIIVMNLIMMKVIVMKQVMMEEMKVVVMVNLHVMMVLVSQVIGNVM